MKKITLSIADHKLQTFLTFIQDLNYVKVITDSSGQDIEEVTKETQHGKSDDFMSLAGMWEGHDVSAEEVRAKAWPTRK